MTRFRIKAHARARAAAHIEHSYKILSAALTALLMSTRIASAQNFDSFMDQYFGYGVFGALVFWWWVRRGKNKRVARDQQQASEQTEEFRRNFPERNSREALAALGATKGERSQRIEDIFNRKSESLTFEMQDMNPRQETGVVVITGTLVRAIAAMAPRERESLRAAYHLFNINEFDPKGFCHVRLALVFGDGKAQHANVNFYAGDNLKQNQNVHTVADAIKYWTGMNAEGAVSAVLHRLQAVATKMPHDPTVKQLTGRLLGGGDQALSSTCEFAQAQGGKEGAGLILGIDEETGQQVVFAGEGSVITVAPPGSGKTQCHVFPTLLSWKGPAVVLDVKGEIYAATSKWRSENVGPVYKFSPLAPAASHGYNPLTPIRSDPDYLWEDSRFLADMMLVPTGGKDPFWENRARDVLTAAIARVCLNPDVSKRSLGDVLDVFHGVGWDQFVRALQMAVDIRSMTRAGSSLGEMERKTRDGVLQTGLSSLSAWDGDRIERATRKSDWSPLDLRNAKSPTIYICLKPNEVESYISVLRVFIAQHIRMLTSSLPPRGAPSILFVLDELPRLRQMPPVEEALEIGRQYGIKLWMFTQSLGQLENAYPNAEGMVGNCALRMYMNPSLHDETAQKISDDIGFQEGVLDNARQKIVEAPVLAGPDYKDYVIVMASGFKPFRVRKSFAYQDAMLKSRMGSL
ncbi:MAG TPA: type IV secretory system conjugative DNA transfer family protein [Micropepsaceae bacterium]